MKQKYTKRLKHLWMKNVALVSLIHLAMCKLPDDTTESFNITTLRKLAQTGPNVYGAS
jgi:hypothetical protein